MPTQLELVLHLLLAAGLAGALGIERELSDQPAGFRTHLLVGLGAALFAVLSAFGFDAVVGRTDVRVQIDVTRVASQIVVGIGFLGGGAIIKYGATVRGLTTAANLWVTAAVGTAAGLGLVTLSVATTVIALLALSLLKPIRAVLQRVAVAKEELVVSAEPDIQLGALLDVLRGMDVDLRALRVEHEGGGLTIVLLVRMPRGVPVQDLIERLQGRPHVHHVEWSG